MFVNTEFTYQAKRGQVAFNLSICMYVNADTDLYHFRPKPFLILVYVRVYNWSAELQLVD